MPHTLPSAAHLRPYTHFLRGEMYAVRARRSTSASLLGLEPSNERIKSSASSGRDIRISVRRRHTRSFSKCTPFGCRSRRSGELVQIDGSDHHWFEDRGPQRVLLVYVDDATGKLMELRMCESESAFSYFHATRSHLEHHGKPVALYGDKAGVFRVNAKIPKAGDGFTQFGRAMSDLNINVICASTPAGKNHAAASA